MGTSQFSHTKPEISSFQWSAVFVRGLFMGLMCPGKWLQSAPGFCLLSPGWRPWWRWRWGGTYRQRARRFQRLSENPEGFTFIIIVKMIIVVTKFVNEFCQWIIPSDDSPSCFGRFWWRGKPCSSWWGRKRHWQTPSLWRGKFPTWPAMGSDPNQEQNLDTVTNYYCDHL